MKVRISYPKPCAECGRVMTVGEWANAGKTEEFTCERCTEKEPTLEESEIPY